MSSRGISEGLQMNRSIQLAASFPHMFTGHGHTGMVTCIVTMTPSAFDIHSKLEDH